MASLPAIQLFPTLVRSRSNEASAALRRSLLGSLARASVANVSRIDFKERRTIRSASFSPWSRKTSPVGYRAPPTGQGASSTSFSRQSLKVSLPRYHPCRIAAVASSSIFPSTFAARASSHAT